MASPELTPGAPPANTLAERSPLKRSSCSAPTILFTVLTADRGTIAPVLERT